MSTGESYNQNHEESTPKPKKLLKTTREIRAQLIEALTPPQDDLEAAALMAVKDLEKLIAVRASRIRKADVAWLKKAASVSPKGVVGTAWDECPSAFSRLRMLGMIVAKGKRKSECRAVITDFGVDALIKSLHDRSKEAPS